MLDRSQQGYYVQRVNAELPSEICVEFDILQLDYFQVADHSEDSGFNLRKVTATSFLSRATRS